MMALVRGCIRIPGLRKLCDARFAALLGLAALMVPTLGSLGGCTAVAQTGLNDLPPNGVTVYGTVDAGVGRSSR